MPITIDSVSSQRVVLRPVSESDLADLMEVNGDPEVTRYLPYKTWQTVEDAEAWFARMVELMASGTALQLAVERKLDNHVIGAVLLFKFDEGSSRVEIGYVLGRAYWQQGYAKEAIRALLSYLLHKSGIRRVEAEVNPENVASTALLESLGFKLEGFLRERWVAESGPYGVNVYGLLASDLSTSRSGG